MDMSEVAVRKKSARGTVLIVVMAIVMLFAGLSSAMLMDLQTRSNRTEADKEDVKSFEAAEAGLDAAIANLNVGGNGCLGIGWYEAGKRSTEGNLDKADLVDDGAGSATDNGFPDSDEVVHGGWHVGMDNQPYDFKSDGYEAPLARAVRDQMVRLENGNPKTYDLPRPQPREFNFFVHAIHYGDVRYFTYTIHWGKDGIANDQDNEIDEEDEQDWYTIYSTGFSSLYLERLSTDSNSPLGRFSTVEAIVSRLTHTLEMKAALELQFAPKKP